MKYLNAKLLAAAAVAIFSVPASALPPDALSVDAEKTQAVSMFLKDQAVAKAVHELKTSGFTVLELSALPFSVFFTDEGPAGRFLVTATFGKSLEFGWQTNFVSAVVDTDDFGAHGVKLVDHQKLSDAIGRL